MRIHTRVDKVVGVVVVSDGTGLGLVELRILDFFELDHGWLVVAAVICLAVLEEGLMRVWSEVKRCAGVSELVCGIVVDLDAVCEA